jgi:3D (Asp-Asp-Asp) domain-containing protein
VRGLLFRSISESFFLDTWRQPGRSSSGKDTFPIPDRQPQGCLGNVGFTAPLLVTGYDNSFQSTGKKPGDPGFGVTANGRVARHGTIAAPRPVRFGTQMYVPGYGLGTVEDRGGAIRDSHIDVWFPTQSAAEQWGKQYLWVTVCK